MQTLDQLDGHQLFEGKGLNTLFAACFEMVKLLEDFVSSEIYILTEIEILLLFYLSFAC